MRHTRATKLGTALAATGLALLALGFISQDQSPPLVLLQTPTEGCDDWPSELSDGSPGYLTSGVTSWVCSGGHAERTRRSRGDVAGEALSPAECKSWCLAAHPPNGMQEWCCEWRAQPNGNNECAWSDGVARQLTQEGCTVSAEKGAPGCASHSLAFEPCLTTTRYQRFGGGRCLLHADVVIGRFAAASRESCARHCAAQARQAEPGELQCKVFAWGKPNYHFRSPDNRRCILLDHCKVRPRESRIFVFYATPEGIPDIPALT